MPDRVYLHGKRSCRVLISPNQKRRDLPEPWPHLTRLRFRGLRRTDA